MNKELDQAMAQLMAMSEEAKAALGSTRNDLKELAELRRQSSELLSECLQLVELEKNCQFEPLFAKGQLWGFVERGPKSKFKEICEPDSALKNRDIYDIVHAINVLAMANTDVVGVNTAFSLKVESSVCDFLLRMNQNLYIQKRLTSSVIMPFKNSSPLKVNSQS